MKPNINTININDTARLKWACRRGMLELDVLLGNFLEQAYSTLTLEEKQAFIELLECSDPQLFAWLIGQEKPMADKFTNLIKLIQQHARSRI